jgi:hypothetical protein
MEIQNIVSHELGGWLEAAHQKSSVPSERRSPRSGVSDNAEEVASVAESVVTNVVVQSKMRKHLFKAVSVKTCK